MRVFGILILPRHQEMRPTQGKTDDDELTPLPRVSRDETRTPGANIDPVAA